MEQQEEEFGQLWQRMVSGEIYDATDTRLLEMLGETRQKLWKFNSLPPVDTESQRQLLDEILGSHGERFHINQPFRCDYGCNISIGEDFFANFNLTILDEAPVSIGCNAFIGPNVSIFTACHPLEATLRNSRQEWAEPVTIGNNVWIGGGAIILPGVKIGNNVVVAAGAVVKHDAPDNTLVAGVPARVVRHIDQ